MKTIKRLTYEIKDGRMVWRIASDGEQPRESVCPDCQIQRPKKKAAGIKESGQALMS